MSLTLILTRHAKSSWHDPLLDDFDRPLNDRGEKSASAIGDWLSKRDLVPGEVIVSGARRTVDTWAGIASRLPQAAKMRSDPALYHAGAQAMLGVLRTARDPIVMLIGHNPGIADFAARLVEGSPDHPRFNDYPTCATTVIQFPATEWAHVDWHQGQCLAFVIPREL